MSERSETTIGFGPVGLAGWGLLVLGILLRRRMVALLGLFPLTGQKITPPAQILPTFQLTVGVAYPVHFLSMFFKEMREGATRADAVVHALGHSGLPTVMTALTTMGGMASFATASLQPLAILRTPAKSCTFTGRCFSSKLSIPSCPAPLFPQALTVPSFLRA